MILVTGGTGLVGSHLLYFLTTSGDKVRAIYRKSSTLFQVEKVFGYYTDKEKAKKLFNSIEWVESDITNIPTLTRAFANCRHVYHCAAMIHFDPKKYDILKKVNVEGTANIVNLALLHGVQKLCYVSSIATLGDTIDNHTITEETPFNQDTEKNVYSLTKYDAEMEVWRGTQEGLNTVIINPGVILGAGFWNTGSGTIIKMASKGIPYYTSGTVGVVDVQDVVEIMQQLMKITTKNERYILVGANLTYKELTRQLALAFDKNPPKKQIAQWKLLLASTFDWIFSRLFGFKRRLLKTTVKSLYTNKNYSTDKIETLLKFRFTSISETVTCVVDRYITEH
ncbi:MAG: dihydroflavonol-4-reductase [Patiriisocius sp.]|jgi:nucleoside-diphosphate-sugar epimerase